MENCIKEQQLFLFADRARHSCDAEQSVVVLFSTMAYTLHIALREFGLKGMSLARAQMHMFRNQLLKTGGRIQASIRQVVLSLSQAYSYQTLFRQILSNLRSPEHPSLQL